jgi:hypothetical protein
MIIEKSLNEFFCNEFNDLQCLPETRSYIISIFSKYKNNSYDYSKQSLTILYFNAYNNRNFFIFQNIGDWIFFCNSVFPESLNSASKEYYNELAKNSYDQCFKLINKQWRIYENLADDFNYLTKQTRKIFTHNI